MFSGIIEEMGVLTVVNRHLEGMRVGILARKILADLDVGESVAVNGVCLTVAAREADSFEVDLSPETIQRTTLGQLTVGDGVNLERSLRYNARIGGHLVSGHVDGMGRVSERRQEGNTLLLTIEVPKELLRSCVTKGSITVDGISLTINQIGDGEIRVAVIPHTAKETTLGLRGIGAAVNVETDLIGKYVERLLQEGAADQEPKIDVDFLKRQGLM